MVEGCDHEYRRVLLKHINPTHAQGEEPLCVVCVHCGRSPVHAIRRGEGLGVPVKGDWPEDLKITGYYWDEDDGPSVEFEKR